MGGIAEMRKCGKWDSGSYEQSLVLEEKKYFGSYNEQSLVLEEKSTLVLTSSHWCLKRRIWFLQAVTGARRENFGVDSTTNCCEMHRMKIDDLRSATLWMLSDMIELSGSQKEGANKRGRNSS